MTKQTPVRNCGETIAPEESDKRFARAIVSDALSRSARPELQPSLDEVGTPASGGHWVIVDLETTGLSADAEITEIGAVRVRDGHLSDEFSSLVCPSRPIPPFITSLTGITPAMVKDAEPIAAVLERFIDWAGLEDERAPVLVAHNASFDVGFLRRAARAAGRHWPKPPVVDTLALARLALPRPLVRNHKLATIASYFGTATTPGHRALGDARATAEVLLGFDLLTSAGVTDVEDLVALSKEAPARRPTVPSFVSEMPTTPGVYHFINASGDTLYVGSASSLRSRVSSYYTRAEKRQKIQRMVSVASGVRTFPTSSILEARIRELRDIASLAPPYNSASRRQACQHWVVRNGHRAIVTPTVALEDLPRALGPFGTRAHATRAANAIARALGEHGSCEVSTLIDEAVAGMIERAVDALYTRDETTALFLATLVSGEHKRIYLADLVSGALIAGIVERAKKYAIKDALTGTASGLTMDHLLRGVHEEMNESLELAATSSPEDWARTSGLAPEIVSVKPIGAVR